MAIPLAAGLAVAFLARYLGSAEKKRSPAMVAGRGS
jgi:hypothetical protein